MISRGVSFSDLSRVPVIVFERKFSDAATSMYSCQPHVLLDLHTFVLNEALPFAKWQAGIGLRQNYQLHE